MRDKKILIVEDEGISALSLQAALNKMGYIPVGIAYTGREAVSMALDLKPDVILMDIRIKGDMDGIQATRKINEFSDVPVIYLTAYADDETASEALTTYACSYLLKPYNPRELNLTIEFVIIRHRMERQLRESEQSYRGLFNSVQEAIYVMDADGKFLEVNNGALGMFGHPRDFFIGKSLDILYAPGTFDLGLTVNRLGHAFNNEPRNFEITGCRSNGETFPAECRLYRGNYFGKDVIIGLVIDITDRMRAYAEEALRKSQERNLVYIKEAAMRLKNPIEVVQQNISTVILDIESGEYGPEEIISQLQLQVKNMEQIRQNIIDLNKTSIEGLENISPVSKKFLTE
jgi:PAS domain S-box-containing protein